VAGVAGWGGLEAWEEGSLASLLPLSASLCAAAVSCPCSDAVGRGFSCPCPVVLVAVELEGGDCSWSPPASFGGVTVEGADCRGPRPGTSAPVEPAGTPVAA
jgi:hypothetical protein